MKNQNEGKHTALPWNLSTNPTWSHCVYGKIGCVAQGNDPASMIHNSERATANAAFIVTACNSHYRILKENEKLTKSLISSCNSIRDLLEALEDIIKECHDTPKELSEACLGLIIIKAKQAIKKSGG